MQLHISWCICVITYAHFEKYTAGITCGHFQLCDRLGCQRDSFKHNPDSIGYNDEDDDDDSDNNKQATTTTATATTSNNNNNNKRRRQQQQQHHQQPQQQRHTKHDNTTQTKAQATCTPKHSTSTTHILICVCNLIAQASLVERQKLEVLLAKIELPVDRGLELARCDGFGARDLDAELALQEDLLQLQTVSPMVATPSLGVPQIAQFRPWFCERRSHTMSYVDEQLDSLLLESDD